MKKIFLVFIAAFALFYPSLFMFFANDDFFFLKVSHIAGLGGFLNFFNLLHGPDGFGMYRPLTTQVFYFLSWKLFNLQPFPLHVISFAVFFGVIYLVYRLIFELSKNVKVAFISAFLYAVSATHFGHLYYLAAFQELGMVLFVLLSCLSFLKNKKILSLVFFILALLSKETAVITPLLLVLIYLFQNRKAGNTFNITVLLKKVAPPIIVLSLYLLVRIFYYGFATGDSYIWDFSIPKLANTSFWYLLWSLNIPESLIDFIGPGLKINPNLFLYWNNQVMPILFSFFAQVLLIAVVLLKVLLDKNKKTNYERDWVSIFCIAWFLIGILPVIFLPLHKFSFYLTISLIGLVFRISYLLIKYKMNNVFIGIFLIIWTLTSILTLKFTYQTNWISQSEQVAKRVHIFFDENRKKMANNKIYFLDTAKDYELPWSPTTTVKTILSNKNFFEVYYPEISDRIFYSGSANELNSKDIIRIESRQFLGY